MFRFRVGPFPVEIHFGHWLLSAFIAWSFTDNSLARTGWPTEVLKDTAHPQHLPTFVLVMVVWMALISTSVLAHELGHAIAARAFGLRPSIHFFGLYGATYEPGIPALEWWRQVLVTLAGPAAGLVFGVGWGALALLGPERTGEGLYYFAHGIFIANLFWTVLNLLPISSFDGGRITELVLTRGFGRTGFLLAQLIALAFAAAALMLAFMGGMALLGIIVVMMSARTLSNISGWYRGELPQGPAAHPLTAVIEQAEALYRDRKLEEAAVLARGLTQASQTPAALRSRAHMLLGWVALKEGEGRRALDAFSQVQGFVVPVHALAAAFSLIGDETRAVPLWAQAAQQTADDTIRHEYAGALLRAGKEAQVRELPGIDLARAWAAAERVFYVRRDYVAAAGAAESAFREEPSARHAYTAACAWALAGRPDDALRMLTLASQNGFADVEEAETDADLRSLRPRSDFQSWLSSLSAAR